MKLKEQIKAFQEALKEQSTVSTYRHQPGDGVKDGLTPRNMECKTEETLFLLTNPENSIQYQLPKSGHPNEQLIEKLLDAESDPEYPFWKHHMLCYSKDGLQTCLTTESSETLQTEASKLSKELKKQYDYLNILFKHQKKIGVKEVSRVNSE